MLVDVVILVHPDHRVCKEFEVFLGLKALKDIWAHLVLLAILVILVSQV